MSDREYPRWVHAQGRKSIVVETPEEEDAFLAEAAAANVPVAPPVVSPKADAPQRYNLVSFEGRRDGDIGGFNEVASPEGKWVRWNDVAALFGGNLLTDTAPAPVITQSTESPTAEPAVKRTGGWPKGKPRVPKEAAVN